MQCNQECLHGLINILPSIEVRQDRVEAQIDGCSAIGDNGAVSLTGSVLHNRQGNYITSK